MLFFLISFLLQAWSVQRLHCVCADESTRTPFSSHAISMALELAMTVGQSIGLLGARSTTWVEIQNISKTVWWIALKSPTDIYGFSEDKFKLLVWSPNFACCTTSRKTFLGFSALTAIKRTYMKFCLTFMSPRGWILMTKVFPRLFLSSSTIRQIFGFEWNVSTTIGWISF